MTESTCRTPGCGAACQRGHLMCKACWHSVSAERRQAVNSTWRFYRAALLAVPCESAALLDATRLYRTAVDNAVAAAVAARP